MKKSSHLASSLVLFAACQVHGASEVDDPALVQIVGAQRVELFALNPVPIDRRAASDPAPAAENVFHGFEILGRAELSDSAKRTSLAQLLQRGLDENEDTVAACFDPRHGVRAELGGHTVELVICFECLTAKIHDSAASSAARFEPIANSVEPEVSRLFESLGLSIAK